MTKLLELVVIEKARLTYTISGYLHCVGSPQLHRDVAECILVIAHHQGKHGRILRRQALCHFITITPETTRKPGLLV